MVVMVGMRANTYICMCSGMVVAGENVERKQADSYPFLSALSSPSSMQVITLDRCWTKPVELLSSFTASPFLLPTLVLTSWNLSFLSSYLAKFTLLTIIHDPPLSESGPLTWFLLPWPLLSVFSTHHPPQIWTRVLPGSWLSPLCTGCLFHSQNVLHHNLLWSFLTPYCS